MASDAKYPEYNSPGGRGTLLHALLKANTQQNISLRGPGTVNEESMRAIGRGLIQNIIAGRGRAMLPSTNMKSDLSLRGPGTVNEESMRTISRGLIQNIIAGRGRAMFPSTNMKSDLSLHGPGTVNEESMRTIGRGLIQNIIAGRGRAMLPSTNMKSDQSLGGAAAPFSSGRGKIPLERVKNLNLGEPSSSLPSLLVDKMEEPSIGKYSGTGGKPLDLEVNYFPLKIANNKDIFHYKICFEPVVDSKNMRHKILNQPNVRAVIGSIKSFDGVAKLYLPVKLISDIVVAAKFPTDNSFVQVRIKYIGTCELSDRLHLYNLFFKKMMSILKMVQIGRNYFNPTDHIDVPMHRLEIWPGYIMSVQDFEGGIMLRADASFKVLRTVTAMEVLTDIMKQTKSKNDVKCKLIGAVVLTKYNNKTYRVDDITWDKSPLSTFMLSDGREISFSDYYKEKYGVIIQDTSQPLLINIRKRKTPDKKDMICLVPELCNVMGLTDDMRSDHKIMRDIASHICVKPTQRQRCFEKFLKNVRETPLAIKLLNDWYLELDVHPLSLTGRALKSEVLMLKHKKVEVSREAGWGRAITNTEILVPADLNNWFIVYMKQNFSKVSEFVKMLKKVCPDMGIKITEPIFVPIKNDRTETYCSSLRSNINPGVQVAVIVFPNSCDDRYSAVKRVCCLEKPILSQCLNVKTIGKLHKLRGISQKIALQINCKLGGELWTLDIPMENIMVCGLDTYRDITQCNHSVLGFVASMNHNLTRWFSRTAIQPVGRDFGDEIEVLFRSALKKYFELNHKLPHRIFLYRVDGMLDYVAKYEVEQLSLCFANIQFDYCPKLSVIVVQKQIDTRLYLRLNGQLDNPPPGSVLDHTVTQKKLYDFFLVSRHVGQGTVTPTYFIVIHDTNRLKIEELQIFTYKLTHLYYNWLGVFQVPAPCQFAYRLAYLVGKSLHQEAHEILTDKLFYL